MSEIEPVLVRGPRPGARAAGADPAAVPDVGSEPALLARIGAEIEASGPLTFARFMSIALADPDAGYYATSDRRPTRAGDFLTAPELHPVFGWTLARALEEAWRLLGRPAPFRVVEFGAGSGSLGLAILDGLRRDGSGLADVVAYEPRDLVPAREATARERLAGAGFARAVARRTGETAPGVVLANEFLDALPVHRLVRRGGRLLERFIGLDRGRLVELVGEPSSGALAARLDEEGVVLADGQEVEVCLELEAWAGQASAAIAGGIVLVLDYGDRAAALYNARRRPHGTALAYLGHRAHTGLLANVGRQDLTAHVDVTAVERALERAGFRTLGVTRQAAFLVGSGLEAVLERARSDPATGLGEWAALRSAVVRLLDPRATGGFVVLAAGRGLPPGASLRGLAGPTGGGA